MKRKKIVTDNSLDKRLTKEKEEVITEKTTDTGERVEKMEVRGQVEIGEVSQGTMTRGLIETTDIMRQVTGMNLDTRGKKNTEEVDMIVKMIVIVKVGTTVRDPTMTEKYLQLLLPTRDMTVNCQLLILWRTENR